MFEHANVAYQACDTLDALRSLLLDFFRPGDTAKLLEVTTDKRLNQEQFAHYKERIKTELAEKLNR